VGGGYILPEALLPRNKKYYNHIRGPNHPPSSSIWPCHGLHFNSRGFVQVMTDQHPVLGEVRYSARELGNDPDGQVVQTVQVMRERVAQDADALKPLAQQVAGQGTKAQQTENVWGHTRGAIQFTRDESTGIRADGLSIGGGDPGNVVEVIIRPVDMARYIDQGIAIGDCDDFSMYLAALLTALEIPCSFCTVAASAQAPNQYSHVYVVAYPDGQRVPCDASHGQYCGWEVANTFNKRTEWPVYDKTRMFLGNLLVNAALVAGVWFGWRWLQKGWV
jgi:hypothetical protein